MKRILGMTSIRSDYDLMSGLYRKLSDDQDVDFKLLVSGAHLSPQFGRSADLISADNIPVLAEIETLISGDSKASRLKTASGLLAASIDIVRQYSPDVILYAGDREDVIVASTIGAFLDIPTVHFFGGDHASDGHVDNIVRHATSKLSTAHFVSTELHAQRLTRLGESSHRIFVIGSIALDKFMAEPSLVKDVLLQNIEGKPNAYKKPLAILIFHPINQEIDKAYSYINDCVGTLVKRGFYVMIGAPNADPGNAGLIDLYKKLAESDDVTFYGNISRTNFVNLMRHSKLMVGNSSAGILEAASVGLPVINIGERQKGRLCGPNVVFSDDGSASFSQALDYFETEQFRKIIRNLVNPYGNGDSENKALKLLKEVDFRSLLPKSEDPLYACP